MELDGEPGLVLVAYALVGTIVHVGEERLPVIAKSSVVDSETVVLAGDETAVGAYHAHRLIVAAVAILELVCLRTACLGKKLIAHADTKYGLITKAHGTLQVVNGWTTLVGVAWAVADEDAIVVESGEIIVPRHSDNLYSTTNKTAEDVAFHTTVYKYDGLLSSCVVTNDFLTRDFVYIVD